MYEYIHVDIYICIYFNAFDIQYAWLLLLISSTLMSILLQCLLSDCCSHLCIIFIGSLAF